MRSMLRALFRPVWYEGYAKPEHVWQSSAGTDDFEAKLGMFPLVFGTLNSESVQVFFHFLGRHTVAIVNYGEFVPANALQMVPINIPLNDPLALVP